MDTPLADRSVIIDNLARVDFAKDQVQQALNETAQRQMDLEDAKAAIASLSHLRKRAVELYYRPRDNWESEQSSGGGYYVVLTTGVNQQIGRQVAICELRKEGSRELDPYQFQATFANASGLADAWRDTLERAICAIDGLIGQQLANVGLPQHPPVQAAGR
jgi:hypothetical protein